MPVELFEHTADIGLRVSAPDLPQLFEEAGRAVASLMIENPEAIQLRRTVTIELEAEDLEGLFVDWLRELLYRFDTEHLLFREHTIHLSDGNRRLRAECRGEPADWTRHQPGSDLKAVTYHQLRVAPVPAGWEATVILDV